MKLILGKVDISSLKKAFNQLQQAVKLAKSELERAGAIQCFEYSYELAWKALRNTLVALGKEALNNPRSVFRDAAANHLIHNPETWFTFIEFRNKTIHTYDESVAREIFGMLPKFCSEVDDMIKRLEDLQ